MQNKRLLCRALIYSGIGAVVFLLFCAIDMNPYIAMIVGIAFGCAGIIMNAYLDGEFSKKIS